MRNLSDPQTRARALRAARSGAPRAIVAPVGRDAGRAVPQPRHDLRARSPTSRARSCRTRSAAGPPALDAGDQATSRSSGPSWPTARRCSASCARACARCATAAPDLADALEIGTPTLQALGGVQQAPRSRPSRRCERFAEDPLVTLGVDDLDEHGDDPEPDDRLPDAGPDGLQLRDAVVPQRRRACSASATPTAPRQRFIIIATPQGPNNEGGPSSAPANGGVPGSRTTTCTPTPTRTPRRRASRRSARPATSPSSSASRSIGNVPGQPGPPTTETTKPQQVMPRTPPQITTTSACRARTARARAPFEVGARGARRRRASASSSASPSTSRSRTASASRPSSSRRTRSARTRRCASRASTSARSPRSRASPAATPPS